MATESFFSNASLAYLASAGAGKDGKAYSIKPTDGSGDFTFSRGSNLAATRVGPTGLIEKGRENLLTYSNDFSNNDWSKIGADAPISGQSGYDGSNDAWKVNSNANISNVRQTRNQTGLITLSVYAKKGEFDYVGLYLSGDGVGVVFSLIDGGVESFISAYPDIYTNGESVGNGWYRFSITHNSSSTGIAGIYVCETTLYSGNTTTGEGIYIQDAQLEIGLAATEVITTGATTGKAGLLEDEPRFDYSGGATCPSLLLEPSRTNSLGQSEYFDGYYAKFATGITYDTNTSETTSPEGLYNATKLISSTNNEQQAIYKGYVISTPTLTCYAKAGEFDTFTLKLSGSASCNFTLTGSGSTGYNTNLLAKSIEPVGNGWYRCSISTTANSVYAWIAITGGNLQGDGTSGIYIYGAQLEQGSYPTSYIPNHSGGSVTRGAEGQTYSGFSSLIGQAEGTLFLDIDGHSPNGTELFSLNRSTTNAIFLDANNDVYRIILYADSVSSTTFTSVANTDRIKIAIAYQSNNFAIYANGLQVATNNTWTWTPNIIIDTLNFSVGGYVNSKNSSKFNQVVLFKERLSNADLETLTT